MMDSAKYRASVPPVVANDAPSFDNPDDSDNRCVPAFEYRQGRGRVQGKPAPMDGSQVLRAQHVWTDSTGGVR